MYTVYNMVKLCILKLTRRTHIVVNKSNKYTEFDSLVFQILKTLRLHIFVFFRYLGKSGLRVSCVGLGKCYNIRIVFFTAFDQSHCNMYFNTSYGSGGVDI
jgi:hypothetical protein